MKNFFANSIKFPAIFFIVITLFVGFFIGGWLISGSYGRCTDKFSFINPVFACLEKNTINKKGYIDLKLNLMSFIEKEKREGRASEIGIFFRDLEAGPTLGINDRMDFIPASLLKLPHALVIFRYQEEESPNILSNTLIYDKKNITQLKQEFQAEKIINANTPYTINELIERSIKYSDNLADELIIDYIAKIGNERDLVGEIYRDLGILDVYDIEESAVGVKAYSSIFRLLYNSSFLNEDNSEKLLKILSENTFKEGLRSGIPPNIKLANKFGERIIGEERQLHDCGIIYYPNNPYLLCVMTKGKDFKALSKIINHISEEVYKEFDGRRLDR